VEREREGGERAFCGLSVGLLPRRGAVEGDLFPEGANQIFSGGISGGVAAQQLRFTKGCSETGTSKKS